MSYTNPHASHGSINNSVSLNNPIALTVTATTAGNLFVLDIETGSGQTISTVADNGTGNTWHQIGTAINDTFDGQLFYRFYTVVQASGSFTTINVTGNAALQAISWVGGEYNSTNGWAATPLNAFDNGTLGTTTTTTDAEVSNNITPLATDLLVSGYDDGAGNVPTITAGTGWTLTAAEPGINAVTGATAQEWKASASGSAQGSTYTVNKTGNHYAVNIESFSQGSVVLPQQPKVVDFAVTRAASY